ncbi:TetR/AcrR family transcriptional regulator [Roseovarius phycicola]|uniref:TetR/AcrR family transcriptional regulator n=1 Tax=Roseovarius phycicola TaxID=3080976 RepID=A0ABZ2HI53_9RHOB
MSEKPNTKTQILDVAEKAVLEKGFEATSIEEIVAAVGISRSGFFYHFKDKNALARALLERYIGAENALFDDVFGRARELNDDPLHAMLIGLKLLAEVLADLPNGHPGCVIAAAAYQDRLFDRGVRELNREAILAWRARFRAMFEEIAERYPPAEPVDLDALGDMVSGVAEGAIVLQKVLGERETLAAQILQLRTYVKLLFTQRPAGAA